MTWFMRVARPIGGAYRRHPWTAGFLTALGFLIVLGLTATAIGLSSPPPPRAEATPSPTLTIPVLDLASSAQRADVTPPARTRLRVAAEPEFPRAVVRRTEPAMLPPLRIGEPGPGTSTEDAVYYQTVAEVVHALEPTTSYLAYLAERTARGEVVPLRILAESSALGDVATPHVEKWQRGAVATSFLRHRLLVETVVQLAARGQSVLLGAYAQPLAVTDALQAAVELQALEVFVRLAEGILTVGEMTDPE